MVRRSRTATPPPPAPPSYDSADATFVSGLLGERWRVRHLLARGALASNFLVTDATTDRPAVARVVHERLARDASASAHIQRLTRADLRIDHPNIVRTLAVSPPGAAAPWAVCEFIEGADLGKVLPAEAPLALPRALALARDIATALTAAHAGGIVHGNLRPSDVLVRQGADTAVVYEFGSPLFGESGLLNDARYAAPELVRDPGSGARASADCFALGTIMFEMLTGRMPSEAPGAMARMLRQLKEPAPDVRTLRADVPDVAAQLLARLLAADPRVRATAAEAGDVLSTLVPPPD